MSPATLNQLLGNADLYLLDQILKGRFAPGMRILDVGCGEGRNLVYFIRQGMDVWGIDRNPEALKLLRMYGKSLHPDFDPEKIIASDWYAARLEAKQAVDIAHWDRLLAYLKGPHHPLDGLDDLVAAATRYRKESDSPEYLDRIKGTLGREPNFYPA